MGVFKNDIEEVKLKKTINKFFSGIFRFSNIMSNETYVEVGNYLWYLASDNRAVCFYQSTISVNEFIAG